MPIELGIWKLGDVPERITFTPIDSEARLEDTLAANISIISPNLMLLGRQVTTAYGKFIDLLALDDEGNLVVIELKKNRTPREAVAQLLDYGSWAQGLSYKDLAEIYEDKNNGEALEEGFGRVFENNPPDELNKEVRLVLVAAELDPASERIIDYLAESFGVPINAVFFRFFKEAGHEYLTRTWLVDPRRPPNASSSGTPGKRGKREPWDGLSYYVAYGPPEGRPWDIAAKYGFISGGGGKWYSRTMEQLSVGDRIFVCVPGHGYVGVGTVTEAMTPMHEFTVTKDGEEVPVGKVLDPSLERAQQPPDKTEYMVRVDWLKTVPLEKAFWEKGMYANQNTVTKLRNQFTLERLHRFFGLEE